MIFYCNYLVQLLRKISLVIYDSEIKDESLPIFVQVSEDYVSICAHTIMDILRVFYSYPLIVILSALYIKSYIANNEHVI